MILKASERGGGMQLGAHLLNSENEHVEVHEVRGFLSGSVLGAMKETQAVARGTRCKQFLFSVSFNPPERETVAVGIFESAIERVEEANGLSGQPRMIVFHEKQGRRHAHCVWSRIDAETMTARPLPFFKRRLQEVSKGLYLQHGWKVPGGLVDASLRDPTNFSLAEWQAAKRTGRDAKALRSSVQAAWAASDSLPAFERALEASGLYLARGDRRAHVVATYEGETFALARLAGRKSKEVVARFGPADELRDVAATRLHIAERIAPRLQDMIAAAAGRRDEALRPLQAHRTALRSGQAESRRAFDGVHVRRRDAEMAARAALLRRGVVGFWDRLTGRHAVTVAANEREASFCRARDRAERDALIAGQLAERRELQKGFSAVTRRYETDVSELHRDLVLLNERSASPGAAVAEPFNRSARGNSRKHDRARGASRGRSASSDGLDLG